MYFADWRNTRIRAKSWSMIPAIENAGLEFLIYLLVAILVASIYLSGNQKNTNKNAPAKLSFAGASG